MGFARPAGWKELLQWRVPAEPPERARARAGRARRCHKQTSSGKRTLPQAANKPKITPSSAGASAQPSTRRWTAPGLSPRARRMPSSRTRPATTVAITPYSPSTASSNAASASEPMSSARKRCGGNACASRSSIVATSVIGRSRSSACTAARAPFTNCTGAQQSLPLGPRSRRVQ